MYLLFLKVYRLPVYDDQGNKFSAEMIYNHLKKLSDAKQSDTLIGHLTADERQRWAPIYDQLSSSKILFEWTKKNEYDYSFVVPENKNLFDTIDDSVLVLCLDDNYQLLDKKDTQTLIGFNFLHGGGTKNNTANRWFDKTLQVNRILKIFFSREKKYLILSLLLDLMVIVVLIMNIQWLKVEWLQLLLIILLIIGKL